MSSYISTEIKDTVVRCANSICEYCLIAEVDAYFKFQIEHIISRKHGGTSDLDNLALACIFCNRYKGSDIATIAPETGELIRLYNLRIDRRREHFYLNGVSIEPLTAIGEATIRILQMNHEDQILERQILARRSRYPSEAAILLITEH